MLHLSAITWDTILDRQLARPAAVAKTDVEEIDCPSRRRKIGSNYGKWIGEREGKAKRGP